MPCPVNKPISRQTKCIVNEAGKDRPVIVILEPDYIGFRLKGCRAIYYVPVKICYRMALVLKWPHEKG